MDLFLGSPAFFASGSVVKAPDAFKSIFNNIVLGWVDNKFLASLTNNPLRLFFQGLQLMEILECGGMAIVVFSHVISPINGPFWVSGSNLFDFISDAIFI